MSFDSFSEFPCEPWEEMSFESFLSGEYSWNEDSDYLYSFGGELPLNW